MRTLRALLVAFAFSLGLAACDSGGDYEMAAPDADAPTAEQAQPDAAPAEER